jgi:hypothetical protein
MNALIASSESIYLGFLERRCSPNNALNLDIAASATDLLPYPTFFSTLNEPLIDPLPVAHHGRGMEERNGSMAIGLEVKDIGNLR